MTGAFWTVTPGVLIASIVPPLGFNILMGFLSTTNVPSGKYNR